jgi:hypothetical protein
MPSADAHRICSPALAGHRGLKDTDTAKYLGNTLHYKEDACLLGDSCVGQTDFITALMMAMSDGLYHVEYHLATSKTPSYRSFVLEVAFDFSLASIHPVTGLLVCRD